MKVKEGGERRRYLRFIIKSKVDIQNKGGKQKKQSWQKICATAKNCSPEGIRFKSREKFKPGTKVNLEISFPSYQSALCLEGEIAWSQALEKKRDKGLFDTGVKLFTIEKNDENKFVGYICDKMMQCLDKSSRV